MQRLVLAILIVAALVAGLAVVVAGLRRAFAADPRGGLPARTGSESVQKLAFTLLIALIAYAALSGGG